MGFAYLQRLYHKPKWTKNYFFKAVNPVLMFRHMEFYSKFCFFQYTLPYRAVLEHLGPHGTIRGHTEPYRAIQGHTRPYGTIWGHMGPQWTKPDHMTLRDQTGPAGRKIIENILFGADFARKVFYPYSSETQ